MKLILRLLDAFDPYVEKIKDSMIRDMARVAVPFFVLAFIGFMVSLPFDLLNHLIDAFVKMAGA
jgi:hypothetical protein